MKEYTFTNKDNNETYTAKSLTDLAKLTGFNRSVLSRYYRICKKGGITKSEDMAKFTPIVKTITEKIKPEPKNTFKLVEGDEFKIFHKKLDIMNHLNINLYKLNKILSGADKSHTILLI